MSDFKANMHQIQFRLGLRSRPRWGSLQRSPPDPSIAGFKGPTSNGGEGKDEGRRRGEERKGKRGREGRDPQGLVNTPMFEILKNTLL